MMRFVVVLALLTSCAECKHAAGTVGGTVAEYTACPLGVIECGHVFVCGDVEVCIDDDDHPEQFDSAEVKLGECVPTSRHQGLCLYCCGPDCGRGCNAFGGCWCE